MSDSVSVVLLRVAGVVLSVAIVCCAWCCDWCSAWCCVVKRVVQCAVPSAVLCVVLCLVLCLVLWGGEGLGVNQVKLINAKNNQNITKIKKQSLANQT